MLQLLTVKQKMKSGIAFLSFSNQEGRPDPVPAERAVPVVQRSPPGAQDRPPQDEPQVPVLPLHRHQGL